MIKRVKVMGRVVYVLIILTCVAVWSLQAGEVAEKRTTLRARITATAGTIVFLDKGRIHGVEVGDTVTLYASSGRLVKAKIDGITRMNSRCSLSVGIDALKVGDVADMFVKVADKKEPVEENTTDKTSTDKTSTDKTSTDKTSTDKTGNVAAHPPWTNSETNFDQKTPLLAPVNPLHPNERPTRWGGSVRAYYGHIWDDENGGEYSDSRIGTTIWVENPLGWGGGFNFDAEYFLEERSVVDDEAKRVSRTRIDRLSYHWGGTTRMPYRVEIGRFLSYEFPQLGVMDGMEVRYELPTMDRIGFNIGAMPAPEDNYESSKTFQTSVFGKLVFGDNEQGVLGTAYTQTTYDGDDDREMVLVTFDLAPTNTIFFNANTTFDHYEEEDQFKDEGWETTEVNATLSWQPSAYRSMAIYASTKRWPQRLQDGVDQTANEWEALVANQSDRYGAYASVDLAGGFGVHGRYDCWTDATLNGDMWESGVFWRDLIPSTTVRSSYYTLDGVISNGYGIRTMVSISAMPANVVLGYDTSRLEYYTTKDSYNESRVFLNVNIAVSPRTSVFVLANYAFGDRQDSKNVSLNLQWRF